MASAGERSNPGADETVEGLPPRMEADPEAELEALRDFVLRGGPATMNHRLWLDLDEFENRVERIIGLLPKEIRRARRVLREEQRLLQDAKDEARRLLEEARAESDQILTAAREEAERLVEASAIRQRAVEQAEATVARAEEAAREVREQSYEYADQVISNVIESLNRLSVTIEADRAELQRMRPGREESAAPS